MQIIRALALAGIVAAGLTLNAQPGYAQTEGAPQVKPSNNASADQAWQALLKASRPIAPPKEWQTSQPSAEQIAAFRTSQGEAVAKAAELAKDFYTRFPEHAKAADARTKEYELLETAVALGQNELLPRLQTLESARLNSPGLTEDERFEIRARAVQRAAMSKLNESEAAAVAEFEKGVRHLQKEFPKRTELFEMLMAVANQTDAANAKSITTEIAASDAPAEIKEAAAALQAKLDRVGQPLSLKFTALDGRQVDLEKMRGKVVLIDFWATWCGPCIAALPEVKSAYQEFHPKGFEIVGISFDRAEQKLKEFVAKQKMDWPQYFDGKEWANELGQKFGIEAIPTMWLVDKKGVLRDLSAGDDLSGKIAKLLAEKE